MAIKLPSAPRREPHQLLFPLGVAIAGIGVLPWIFFALGLTDVYRPIFHSVVFRSMFHPLTEIEGFLTCFAVGFVFTVLPRRTATPPPARWQMAIAIAAPSIVALSAAVQKWAIGEVAWLLLLGVAAEFALRRLKLSLLRPATFWVATAILSGAVGTALTVIGEASGQEWLRFYEVGRSLLTQGVFTALVLGTASLLFSRAERSGEPASSSQLAFAAHAFACALFFASFWVDSVRLAFGLRAAVTFGAVASLARAMPPRNPGEVYGRAARTALWMVPVGNAWVALAPMSRRAGMHVIFVACFTMLALVCAGYLLPDSDRRQRPTDVRRWQLGLGAGCLAVALAASVMVELDPPSFNLWLGIACVAFIAGTLFALGGFTRRIAKLLPDHDGTRVAPPR